MANWLMDGIMNRWRGKTVAVLGARSVGKTSLISFMGNGHIPENPSVTIGLRKAVGVHFTEENSDIKIDLFYDVSGAPDGAYRQWEHAVEQSNWIFYLINSCSLLREDPETLQRVETDTVLIHNWVEDTGKRIALVGTHADLDARFQADTPSLHDDFISHPEVTWLLRRTPYSVPTVVGSLLNDDSARHLVVSLFQQIQDLGW